VVHLSASPAEEDEDITSFWLITYSDMTTLLLAFFLLMFSFTLMSQKRQEELLEMLNKVASGKVVQQRSKEELEAAAREIAAQFKKEDTFVETTEEEVTVGLSSAVTFRLGDDALSPEAQQALATAADIIRKMSNAVRVEGHTDDIPMRGGRFSSNWHLSAARAQSVVRLLMERGVDPRRLEVVGYGEVRPRQPNDSERGRAANRRIEIKLIRAGTR